MKPIQCNVFSHFLKREQLVYHGGKQQVWINDEMYTNNLYEGCIVSQSLLPLPSTVAEDPQNVFRL